MIKHKYDYLGKFGEGYFQACKNGKWGFITPEDSVAIPFEYDYVSSFSNGIADVKLHDEWFCIDLNGNRVERHDEDDLTF